MTVKFGRTYRLTIDPNDGGAPIVVQLPFTMQFWVERDIMADLNRVSVDIFNLSAANRSRIYQDRFNLTQFRKVTLEIGYGQLFRVFEGRIFEASSAREGVNIVTRIEARDGQFDVSNSQTIMTVQAGQTLGDVFKTLIGQFPNLQIGAIGNWPEVFNRPVSLNGNTWDLIKQYSGGLAYIDSGNVYVLNLNEVLKSQGQVPLINDATGLLETPRRNEAYLSITTLMEPNIKINQLVHVESSVQPVYNGQYSVIGINHQGVISSAICGSARSTFSLLHPEFFGQFTEVPGQ